MRLVEGRFGINLRVRPDEKSLSSCLHSFLRGRGIPTSMIPRKSCLLPSFQTICHMVSKGTILTWDIILTGFLWALPSFLRPGLGLDAAPREAFGSSPLGTRRLPSARMTLRRGLLPALASSALGMETLFCV